MRIWAGSPPERIGLKLSQFLMEYQKIPITVSDYVPEQMKGMYLLKIPITVSHYVPEQVKGMYVLKIPITVSHYVPEQMKGMYVHSLFLVSKVGY